jgi:hypothetical protein
MLLPKQVKIGPHVYKVEFPFSFTQNGNLCGQVDSTSNEIRLARFNQGQPYSVTKIWETFFHEIAHIIFNVAGIEHKEIQCDIVAHTTLAILMDNNWLIPEIPQEKETA